MELELNKEYTYKEICETLDWKYSYGDSKIAQINQLKAQYEVKKHGTKYQIIREKPAEEALKETESRVFSTMLCNKLMDWLAERQENNEKVVVATYREIMEENGLVNQSYFPVKYKEETVYIKAPAYMTKYDVERSQKIWMQASETVLHQQIEQACKKIMSRSLCVIGHTFRLYKRNQDGIIISANATEEQERQILKIQERAMNRFCLSSMKALICADNSVKALYRDEVLGMLRKEVGYDFYGAAIKFNVIPDLRARIPFNRFEINQGAYELLSKTKQITNYVPQKIAGRMIDETIKI